MYGTDDGTINTNKANYFESFENAILHPINVGSYPANPFGLYDMSGNVWEWCNDWYGEYSSESIINPTGAQFGSHRIRRGASWTDNVSHCRTSARIKNWPFTLSGIFGFRVVRRPDGVTY